MRSKKIKSLSLAVLQRCVGGGNEMGFVLYGYSL